MCTVCNTPTTAELTTNHTSMVIVAVIHMACASSSWRGKAFSAAPLCECWGSPLNQVWILHAIKTTQLGTIATFKIHCMYKKAVAFVFGSLDRERRRNGKKNELWSDTFNSICTCMSILFRTKTQNTKMQRGMHCTAPHAQHVPLYFNSVWCQVN